MSDLVIAPMTRERALEVVGAIRSHLENALTLSWRLVNEGGLEVLGCKSLPQCLMRFAGVEKSHAYRISYMVDMLANSPTGENLPTQADLRPLVDLPREAQPIAYGLAQAVHEELGDAVPLVTITRQTADTLHEALETGSVSVDDQQVSLQAKLLKAAVVARIDEATARKIQYIKESQEARRQTASIGARFVEISKGEGLYHITLAIDLEEAASARLANRRGRAIKIYIPARKVSS